MISNRVPSNLSLPARVRGRPLTRIIFPLHRDSLSLCSDQGSVGMDNDAVGLSAVVPVSLLTAPPLILPKHDPVMSTLLPDVCSLFRWSLWETVSWSSLSKPKRFSQLVYCSHHLWNAPQKTEGGILLPSSAVDTGREACFGEVYREINGFEQLPWTNQCRSCPLEKTWS